jgi:hypothetical protein
MRRLVLLLIALSLLLAGCVRVAYEPALPMPDRPNIRFSLENGKVCLSEEDADKLAKYMDKLNAFDAARQRALEE